MRPARHAAKGVEYCLRGGHAPRPPVMIFTAPGITWRWPPSARELSAAGPLVELEKQLIRCQEAQVASQGAERARAAAEPDWRT